MIKGIDSEYEPGKRSQHWAKLKKDYVKGLGTAEESALSDCVDVCVVGATMGKGRRAGVYGAYLVAVWNEDRACFQTICEVGTGFSDQRLTEFTEFFKEHIATKPPHNVQYGKSSPQFFIKPAVVWEIAAADITISPTAACCYGEVVDDGGISLRFGRFLRIREDKDPVMCTTSSQIMDMYYAQPNRNDN
jgi:DNA ligase-1